LARPAKEEPVPLLIEDYALIGDMQTAALVGRNGAVDWLCLPRFDSPSCFSALVGNETHGRWLLAPNGEVRTQTRRYRPGTLVLETDLDTAEGSRERAGKEALLSTKLFRNRASDLALVTQNSQWLLLMGTSFVVAVYLQTVRGYNAIETGVIFTAATLGVLVSSLAAERLAKRRAQKTLIVAGFVQTLTGIGLLVGLVYAWSSIVALVPGLLLIGLGLGVMLTPSVNVVQSSFPEEQQGEISGLSRSVSNLGSSFGTAIAGTILVSDLASGNRSYALAMVALAVAGLIGLVAALFLPARLERQVRTQ
jgi:Na+/melibiose symporter-like transporter